jgi:HEAT repeat protein
MNLSDKDPLSFLSGNNILMSGWDAAKIYVLLSKLPDKMIPDFGRWLDSDNPEVQLFCMQMISSFRQQASSPKLIELLQSENETIRLAAIRAIRELNASEAEKVILEMYPRESPEMKLEILKTLEVIGSQQCTSFLEKVMLLPIKDYSLLIQAARSLLTLGSTGQAIIERIFMNSGDEMKLIINHAKDKRL